MNYIDVVNKQKNIIKWSKKHPNKRIIGSQLYHVKTKKNLNNLFKNFNSKKFLHSKQTSCLFSKAGGILQEKNKTLYTALIQTRTSSKRLKNKVLYQILNEEIFKIVYKRVLRSKLINKAIILTTTLKADDKIVKICKKFKNTLF